MIFDHRVYAAQPIQMDRFLELYERVGLPLQRYYLGEPFGFFQTHIGELNRLVHLWQYPSLADRELRRDAMESDPQWQAYRQQVAQAHLLVNMRNEILRPVGFFHPAEQAPPAYRGE